MSTYDKATIQARLLANISDDYDKTEGQFIYDVEKPVSIELEGVYTTLDGMLDKRYADTATGKNLDRIVKGVGLTRKVTIKSYGHVTVSGIVGSAINKGEYVASDSVNFQFTESASIPLTGSITVGIECVSYGTIGNVPAGAIKYFPKTLQGLQTVTNLNEINNGYDKESNEALRIRYYAKVQTPATSGNKYHYRNWALEVTGTGNARVIPLSYGKGTVKIIIINSNNVGADETLVSAVKNYIDPVDGMGEGQAPIGAVCTVVSATELQINITVALIIDTLNTTSDEVISNIENSITEYLATIAFNQSYVSYAKIGSIILNSTYVQDYSNLKLNGGVVNVPIADSEVAILGGVVLG